MVGRRSGCGQPGRVRDEAGGQHSLRLDAGETKTIRARLCATGAREPPFSAGFDELVEQRRSEADVFYGNVNPHPIGDELRAVQRQAFAGLLWTKQCYQFVVAEWLEGDPARRRPRRSGGAAAIAIGRTCTPSTSSRCPTNGSIHGLRLGISPSTCVALALIDPEFAKHQLVLLTREWYMHPNGQLPAYEWNFGDVNPPVHAWAAMRVYQIEKKTRGRATWTFLERVFQKLLLNFTWWVNRKDVEGNNVFQGGFLGLDNIGIFDRSARLPTGGLHQSVRRHELDGRLHSEPAGDRASS